MKISRNGIAASIFAAGAAMSSFFLAGLPAAAQAEAWHPYNTWQEGWDQGHFDRHHVMLGRVLSFHAYRLQIRRREGRELVIDLKNGTIIRPTGVTPQSGNRVAVEGYWSKGTFIANRVIVR